MSSLKENLERSLRPLYEKILKDLDKDNTAFFIQFGAKYPEEKNKGIVFVGRSVNGWLQGEDKTFENLIIRRMKWMQEGKNGIKTKSQFIRVSKNISHDIYITDDNTNNEWHTYIAWSNLYKVSPKDIGNPSKELKNKYIEICKSIFETEIEVLSPKIVVLLTGWTWAKPFLLHLNNGEKLDESQILERKIWDENKEYYAKAIKIKDIIYILSEHPQGKLEEAHVKAILELIHKYE